VSVFFAVLRAEAEAVVGAAGNVSPDTICRAVELLAQCRCKVVVSGVGKSGIIGRKIAATLASTGTAAVFLHAGDATHGDLGILQPGDVGLLLSQSGETDELVALLPQFHVRHIPLIGLVGDLESTLGRSVEVALSCAVGREACPFNLAPTASTTVALALGDALAMATMSARGFTQDDFARNHPSGRLGKRLTVRVRDLMHGGSRNPIVEPTAPWSEVIGALCRRCLGAVNVVNPGGGLGGLVTDGDVRRTVQRIHPTELVDLTAAQMMTPNPTTVGPDLLAYEALRMMEDRPSQISVLPVVEPENGTCLGLLRLHDILQRGLV